MKNTLSAILFLFSMVLSWLFFTLIWTVFSDMTYFETLKNPGQLAGFMLIYWWMPGLFIMSDLEEW
jgi:hypothetical protein